MSEKKKAHKVEEEVENTEEIEEVENTEDRIDLEAYVVKTKPNKGLVASFKVENPSAEVELKTEEEWDRAFTAQSNKIYK